MATFDDILNNKKKKKYTPKKERAWDYIKDKSKATKKSSNGTDNNLITNTPESSNDTDNKLLMKPTKDELFQLRNINGIQKQILEFIMANKFGVVHF